MEHPGLKLSADGAALLIHQPRCTRERRRRDQESRDESERESGSSAMHTPGAIMPA